MLTIAKNKKAFFDYEILEKFEAGLVLTGDEAKAMRLGNVSLQGAFVKTRFVGADAKQVNPEMFLVNAHLGNAAEPTRSRKLLLKKKEIGRLFGKTQEKNLTIVPLVLYFTKRGIVKVEIALARGLKKHDKRERLKKKHQKRSAEREL